MTKIAILGAAGRMGRAIIADAPNHPDIELTGLAVRSGHEAAGQPARVIFGRDAPDGVMVTEDARTAIEGCDVAVDFTGPEASLAHMAIAAELSVPILVGTTGFSGTQRTAIDHLATRTAILLASNTSLGVTLLSVLVEQAARALPGEAYDIEIVETHHKRKKDAPSGTALTLGEAAAAGRWSDLASLAAYGRSGPDGERKPGEIGFASLRAGDVIGEHTVLFAGQHERLELTHRAHDRSVFADGALKGALWLVGKAPGLYAMRHVLGL